MDNYVFIIVVASIVALNVLFFWVFLKRRGGEKNNDGLLFLQNQMSDLTRTLDTKLSEASKNMNESVRTQFSESAKIIREVTEGLTKLDETNKQVVSFADQLQSLQNILQNPKQRGVLGEYY